MNSFSTKLALVVLVAFVLFAGRGANAQSYLPQAAYPGSAAAIQSFAPYSAAAYGAPYASPYASPYAQVGYQPAVWPSTSGPRCAAGSRPYPGARQDYRAYQAGYAPYTARSICNWSSTTPRQYPGQSLFGTPALYGKDEPLRNIFRFLLP